MENIIEQKTQDEEQWPGYSNHDVSEISSWISKTLFSLGVQNQLGKSFPNGAYIQADGFNIRFEETDYGCEMDVYIFKQNKGSVSFRELWKLMVNRDLVWGGPYKKTLDTVQSKTERPLKETLELNRPKYSRISNEAKKYIVEAFIASKTSAENFTAFTINRLAKDYHSTKTNLVIAIFKEEYEKKAKNGRPFDEFFLDVGYFVQSDRLNKWRKDFFEKP